MAGKRTGGSKKAKALPPKMITVHGEIVQETEDEILVRCDNESDGAWLPKSQIEYDGARGDTGVVIEMPEWLADDKGFFDGMGRPQAKASEDNWIPAEQVDASPDVSSEESDSPSGKRVFAAGVKWIKEEIITYTQPLNEAEKAKYADQMAALDERIEALEDERSEVSSRLKKLIDAKEEERRELARSVRSGKEEREAFCDCLKDYNTEEMVWTEAEPPHREIMRRKMTYEERQPKLLEYEEKLEKSAPAEGVDFDDLGDDDKGEQEQSEQERCCAACEHRDVGGDTACETCGDDLINFAPVVPVVPSLQEAAPAEAVR